MRVAKKKRGILWFFKPDMKPTYLEGVQEIWVLLKMPPNVYGDTKNSQGMHQLNFQYCIIEKHQ